MPPFFRIDKSQDTRRASAKETVIIKARRSFIFKLICLTSFRLDEFIELWWVCEPNNFSPKSSLATSQRAVYGIFYIAGLVFRELNTTSYTSIWSQVNNSNMWPCMKLRHLQELLQQIDDFDKPNIALEQYITPPHLASHMLHTMQVRGIFQRPHLK